MRKDLISYRPSPTFSGQFFRDMKNKLTRKITKKSRLPWMKHKELDLLLEILVKKKPERCLEWGSGFSTVLFPGFLNDSASWTSIEHNREWFDILSKESLRENVDLNVVEPDHTPFRDPERDGSYEDFKTYINRPQGQFDFIFIDGRARKHCVRRAFDLIKEDGVVILHDANRVHYHEPLDLFENRILFDDHHDKYGGVWIGTKGIKINEFLDTEKHRKLWKKHLGFDKIISFQWF